MNDPVFSIISDQDLSAIPAGAVVRWMREAVHSFARGELQGPPRSVAGVPEGQALFTVGRVAGAWYGFRSQFLLPTSSDQNVVCLYDDESGELLALSVGRRLPAMRTGALGGVAVDALSRVGQCQVVVVGAGTEAWHQIWAISAVRPVDIVLVLSRREASRTLLARRIEEELGLRAMPVVDARAAVKSADVVVLATSAQEPVIEASWLKPGAHVSTLGPKQLSGSEFGDDLLAWADQIVTDSVPQLLAYDPAHRAAALARSGHVLDLGAALSSAPRNPSNTLFLSTGLAGTEVYLLERIHSHLMRAG